jgi:DNA polymerase-3 subunit chi
MAEVLFYHLSSTPLERNLPGLVEKSLERGWRVLLRCGTEAGVSSLDTLLWTYRDDGFLPHGTPSGDHADRQPVCLTCGAENPNSANVLMLVEGARATPEEMAGFERTCLMFDGSDPDLVQAARDDWKAVKLSGISAKYWAQESGRWVQKATS